MRYSCLLGDRSTGARVRGSRRTQGKSSQNCVDSDQGSPFLVHWEDDAHARCDCERKASEGSVAEMETAVAWVAGLELVTSPEWVFVVRLPA